MRNLALKLLAADNGSINSDHGRVIYPPDGSWVDVPGNGAYLAITGGLTSGGCGPVVAVLEYDPESATNARSPDGTPCCRRVRRVPELEAELRADSEWRRADSEWRRADAEWWRAAAEWERASAEWRRAYAECERADAEWKRASAEWKRADDEWRRADAERERADVERERILLPWLAKARECPGRKDEASHY